MKKNKKLKKKYQPAHARQPKKGSSRSVWLWCAMGLLLFVVVAVGAYFASASLFDRKRPTRVTEPRQNQTETLLVATDKATIMIMGVDERTDDVGRSDTLMIAAVDPRKKSASLLSIPRDTRVVVPGYGYDKINVAYSLGGHELTKETVEEFLDTPIDHYVLIKVPAFKRIIDAIGGVDIDVEKRMYYVDEWDDDGGLYIDLYPGMQHMDGATAITYVRYRDEEGDIGRVERQQKFMKAVMDRVMSPSILTRLPDIIREVMSSVETDLSFRQILELAGALKEAQAGGLQTDMVSGRPVYIDEISYWIPDLYDTRESVASMLGIVMTRQAKDELDREASAYEASIPAGATDAPTEDMSIGRPYSASVRPSMGGRGERVDAPADPRLRPDGPGRAEEGDTARPARRGPSELPRPDTGGTGPENTRRAEPEGSTGPDAPRAKENAPTGGEAPRRTDASPGAAEQPTPGAAVQSDGPPAEKESGPPAEAEKPAVPSSRPATPDRANGATKR